MNVRKIYFFWFFLILNQILFSQWIKKNNGISEDWSLGLAIDAVDTNIAVISVRTETNPQILLTTNSGISWKDINPFEWPEETIDISIKDENHIWAVTNLGRIVLSNNGGTTWITQYYDTTKTNFFNYIEMFDTNNGIAMGDALNSQNAPAVFLKTNNGGKTWEWQNNFSFYGGWSGSTWRRIDFINTECGYFFPSGGGINTQILYKTINQCNSWNKTNYPNTNLQTLKFYDEKLGLASATMLNSDTTLIFRTSDGGNNWKIFKLPKAAHIKDFEFIPGEPSNIWAIWGKQIIFSNDTGKSWGEFAIYENETNPRDLVFTSNGNGWLLCDNEDYILYTINNGGIITNVEEKREKIPTEIKLYQNYPNPFNPSTTISFRLPEKNIVTLKVYDILGSEVAKLVNESREAGNHEVTFDASKLSSGIYYYQIKAGNFVQSRKMLLIK